MDSFVRNPSPGTPAAPPDADPERQRLRDRCNALIDETKALKGENAAHLGRISELEKHLNNAVSEQGAEKAAGDEAARSGFAASCALFFRAVAELFRAGELLPTRKPGFYAVNRVNFREAVAKYAPAIPPARYFKEWAGFGFLDSGEAESTRLDGKAVYVYRLNKAVCERIKDDLAKNSKGG